MGDAQAEPSFDAFKGPPGQLVDWFISKGHLTRESNALIFSSAGKAIESSP
jgi:hypothetical protein